MTGSAYHYPSPHARMTAPALGRSRWTAGFWADRFALCHDTILPSMRRALEDPSNKGRLAYFRIAAGLEEGAHEGTDWSDGDCYKWLEAMAHVHGATRDPDLDRQMDEVPLREETVAVGHAVTATYLWAGAADVFAETGEATLREALERIWNDIVATKLYITGAVGADHFSASIRHDPVHEAFGLPHDLPNATAYTETCANIGQGMWAWRMAALTGDARYGDVLEQVLYNSGLSGMSAWHNRGNHPMAVWLPLA